MAAKGIRAKASKAIDAAADQTTENGASAPSSLAPGVAGDAPAAGAAGGEGGQAGDSNENGDSGGSLALGGAGAVGGGNGAADQSGGAVPGSGAADGPDAAESAGGSGADGGDPAGLPDPGDSGSLEDGQPLSEEQAAQIAGQVLAAGGVGEALLGLLGAGESEQTTSEEGAAAPVTSTAWELPEIGSFPAQITVQNNTPSRVVVGATRLEAYSSLEGLVDEDGYRRIGKSLAAHARLGKWDNLFGVQVKYDHQN